MSCCWIRPAPSPSAIGMASDLRPAPGVTERQLADAAQLASLADATPEGRSIVVLAKEKFNIRARELAAPHATFIPFTAQTRMSGVDVEDRSIRKGAAGLDEGLCARQGRRLSSGCCNHG